MMLSLINMITIRDAVTGDTERLLEIYDHYVKNTAITFDYDTPSEAEFSLHMEEIKKKYPFIVITDDDRILGYAYAGPFKDREAYKYSVELSVYLDHSVTHRGLGRMLYEEMEKRLADQSITNLYACIGYPETEDEYLTKNSAQFHEAMGFTLAGKFRKCGYKFGRWYDMIWMEKMIGKHR